MELSSLETKFFKEILNAELDVPVEANLRYENNSLEMIVVPEVTPSGHFELKYYNAPAAEPECNLNDSGALVKEWQLEEAFGRHPLMQLAWRDDHMVSLQLHTSPMPLQPKVNPSPLCQSASRWNGTQRKLGVGQEPSHGARVTAR